MVDIDRLLNTTSAGEITKKLDALDGNSDGKISGSVWNKFVEGKGGKKISETGSISIANALNSITTYVVREAKKAGKNVEALAKEWSDGVAKGGGTNTPAIKAENAKGAAQKQIEADYQSVEVTVPNLVQKALAEADAIVSGLQSWGKKYTRMSTSYNSIQELLNILQRTNKDNVAYVIDKFPNLPDMIDNVDFLGFGLDKDDVYNYVLKPLIQKAKDLNIPLKQDSEYEQMSLEEMKKEIQELVVKIKQNNNQYLSEEFPKAQKTFDDANRFLAEVANMNPKPEIEPGHDDSYNYDWKQVNLPDGRWIEVSYDDKGEISAILISHDTTPDVDKDGSKYDGAEIKYTENDAYYSYDHSNGVWKGSITSGYDFDKLKALAEKIFGKGGQQ